MDEMNFGPERLILFHSPDPDELGIRLDHGPDGRVRIVSVPSEEERSPGGSSTGVIEGRLGLGDVVMEAAGVNLRRPVSDHMWLLTTGLMRVAPRPIEVIVAEEQHGREGGEEEREGGSYFQLSVGADAALKPTVHRMPVSPGAIGHHNHRATAAASPRDVTPKDIIPPCSPMSSETPEPTQVVHDPFQDPGRFGPERTVTFYNESLGIKLHRSPTEGIVHILNVTPYKPFGSGSQPADPKLDVSTKLDAGDTILEVGGVSLRGKVIGPLEWADMVHFIKHVGRPLDMVVAKDKLYTRERAGVAGGFDQKVAEVQKQVEDVQINEQERSEAKTVMDAIVEEQAKKETENAESEKADADVEEKKEVDADSNEELHAEAEAMFGDASCFSVTLDDICTLPTEDICNIPCAGAADFGNKKDKPWMKEDEAKSDVASSVLSSPAQKDNCWIKKFDLSTPVEDDGANDAPTTPVSPNGSPKKKDDSWIKKPVEEEEKKVTKPTSPHSPARDIPYPKDASKTSAIPSMYPRTSPVKAKPASSPGKPPKSPTSPKSPTDQPQKEKNSVAQLRDMFSPIKAPPATASPEKNESVPKAKNTSVADLMSPIVPPKDDEAAASPMLKASTPTAKEEKSTSDKPKAELKSLFSPIVADPMAPKSPTEDYSELEAEKAPSGAGTDLHLPSPTARADSPSEWSVTSPMSNQSEADSISASSVAKSLASVRSADVAEKEAKLPAAPLSPAQEKRNDLAQSILRGKRASPRGSPKPEETPVKTKLEPTPAKETPKLESTPSDKQPINESAVEESPFHAVFLKNLQDEFTSPDKTLRNTESRDDTDGVKQSTSFGKKDVTILPKPERKNHLLATRPEQHSPTGSTVSVEDRKNVKTPTAAKLFSERSFRVGDAESPFVGNIKFATPTQRVPQSSLFSQAFVVANENGDEPGDTRWVATGTPLFVRDDQPAGGSSYLQFHSPAMESPTEKESNTSAFDMTSLEDSLEAGEGSDGSIDLNETIVYADDTEAENPLDCCGAGALCGSEGMFEGLVQTCGDVDAFKQKKEKVNKVPSPRRKNLLSRLRKKGKKNKVKSKVEYGNLDDEEREEPKPKGVRNARVQLARQKFGGATSMHAANQFSMLVDDEICL